MWTILKAELAYNRLVIAITLSVFLYFLLFAVSPASSESNGIRSAMIGLWATMMVYFSFVGKGGMWEKRDRFHILLPLSPLNVRLGQLGSILLFWVFLSLCFFLYIFLYQRDWDFEHLWRIYLAMNSFILASASSFFIFRDMLTSYYTRGRERIFVRVGWALFWLSIMAFTFIGMGIFEDVMEFKFVLASHIVDKLLSLPGLLLCHAVSIGIFVFSIVLFLRRPSFIS